MDVINDTNPKKDYTFHLAAFNGPLELLMHLIEKNKIDIYDIPIAELTRQYLDYLEAMREMDMEVTSAFLVMAATLLQIKSRMMLPKKKAEENEEEDPRQELVERLLEYRRFKEVSEVLGSMADLQEHFVGRAPLDLPVRHLPPESLDLNLLLTAFREVMSVKGEEAGLPAAIIRPEPYHIEDKMEEIEALLRERGGRMRFEDAFERGTRGELVVTFLALLELMKQRTVTAQQSHLFGAITLSGGTKRTERTKGEGQRMNENEAGRQMELSREATLEAVLFAAGNPLPLASLAAIMDCEESEVVELARSLQAKLTSEGSGLTVPVSYTHLTLPTIA